MKNGYGPDGTYSDVAADNGLPVAGGYVQFSGSASATSTDLLSQDVSAYRWVSVQFTGTWTATVAFQCSNDGTNWVNTYLSSIGLSSTSWASNAQSTGIYVGPVQGRYFRIRTTAYTSGTVNVVAGFTALPGIPARQPLDGMSVTVAGVNTYANSDAVAPGTGVVGVSALASAYNGTNWERVRSFGAQGAIGVTPTPGTAGGWSVVSYPSWAGTKTDVKASAGTFGGYVLNNQHSAVLFVQVFNALAANVTLGTTLPVYVVAVPPSETVSLEFTCGVAHSTAISVAVTTTSTGSTTGAGTMTAAFFYK